MSSFANLFQHAFPSRAQCLMNGSQEMNKPKGFSSSSVRHSESYQDYSTGGSFFSKLWRHKKKTILIIGCFGWLIAELLHPDHAARTKAITKAWGPYGKAYSATPEIASKQDPTSPQFTKSE